MTAETYKTMFKDNPYFEEYVTLLVRLHSLMREGNEAEAERVRDLMDLPGLHLTDAEVKWVKRLSAELYLLADEEVMAPNPYSPPDYLRRLDRAFAQKDAEALLALLRMEQQVLTKERIATARSQAYQWLGFPQVAREFLGAAVRFAPDSIRRPAFA